MSEYSIQDVAQAAGVEAAYVENLVELGILSAEAGRLTAGDVRRATVVRSLDRAGLPLVGIAEAVRRGQLSLGFMDDAAYDRFGAISGTSFEALADRTGIAIELLLLVREAMGFAQPDVTDHVRSDELDVVPALQAWISRGFRPAVIARSLRTYGDSLRRIADTEADAVRSEILTPLFEIGLSAADVAAKTSGLDAEFSRATDQAILAIYRGRQANAWLKNLFEGIEGALTRAGLHSRLEHPPAICFLDLAGYTRLTDERGDDAALELAGRLERLVQRMSTLHGGKAVKFLGDGVMFHFPVPGNAVAAALEMVAGTAAEQLPPAHVGIHAGPVLFQGGDYFGRTVNLASRIADYARPGEVLVSHEVVTSRRSGDRADGGGVSFVEIGPVELKGISGPVLLYSAKRGQPA